MGEGDLLGRVAGLFTQDAQTSLEAIREAAARDSATDLHEALHKLIGTSANLGASRVAALCRQLDHQTAEGRSVASKTTTLVTGDQLGQLEAELGDAHRALARAVQAGR